MNATLTMIAGLFGGAALLTLVGISVAEVAQTERCRAAGVALGVEVRWAPADGGCYQLAPAYGWVPLRAADLAPIP